MERRDFLRSSVRVMLVTTGLFIAGKVMTSCNNDDDNRGGYYDGYDDGYYDDRPGGNNTQNQVQNQRAE